MGVLMLFAMHFPRNKIYLFMILPVEIRWVVLLYIIFDLHPVLLMLSGQPTGSGVAHAAHLGGLFSGWLYYRRKIKLEPLLSKVQSKTHEKKSRSCRMQRTVSRIRWTPSSTKSARRVSAASPRPKSACSRNRAVNTKRLTK